MGVSYVGEVQSSTEPRDPLRVPKVGPGRTQYSRSTGIWVSISSTGDGRVYGCPKPSNPCTPPKKNRYFTGVFE